MSQLFISEFCILPLKRMVDKKTLRVYQAFYPYRMHKRPKMNVAIGQVEFRDL